MPYSLTNSLGFGPSHTGLTITPALVDTTGGGVAGLTSNIVEVGLGWYLATHSVPDGHHGAIKYTSGSLELVVAINPGDVENQDAKVSSRADAASYTPTRAALLDNLDAPVSGLPALVWTYTTRTLTAFGAAVDLTTGAIAAIWNALTSSFTQAGSVGLLLKTDIDATISSRLAASAYVVPPTAQQNATQVWGEPVPGVYGPGTAGRAVASAASAGDPWATLVPGAYGAGTAGNILGTRLDAAITSRPSVADYTPARAAKLDNLDLAISTRADAQFYTQVRAGNLDNLTRLDVAVSSRSTLTAAQVDALLSTNHGPGNWEKAAGAGSGAFAVTVTIRDDANAPVQGALVTVKNAAQTQTLSGDQPTRSDGTTVFNLDAGTYTILVSTSSGYQTLPPQTLAVAGTASVTYTLTRVGGGAGSGPPSGATAQVYGFITRITGQPAVGVPVTFSLPWSKPGEEQPQPGILIDFKKSETVSTDANGYFQINLIRSSQLLPYGSPADLPKYRVQCDPCGIDTTFTLPDVASLDLTSLWIPYPSVP